MIGLSSWPKGRICSRKAQKKEHDCQLLFRANMLQILRFTQNDKKCNNETELLPRSKCL